MMVVEYILRGKLGTMERYGHLNERSRITYGGKVCAILEIERKSIGYHFEALLRFPDGIVRGPITLSHMYNVYEVPASTSVAASSEWIWW